MNYDTKDIKSLILREFKARNLSIRPTLTMIGISKNTLDNANTSMPKADTLAKIADYLNCSVDYLLGRTPCPDINISGNTQNNINGNNNISINNNDELASELSTLLKSLNLRKRTELMTMIYQFVDDNKKE